MKTRNARGAQRFAFPPYSCYYLMKFRHCVDRDCLRFALFYQGVGARRDKPAPRAASPSLTEQGKTQGML
jgi:hypothetical protein